MKIKRELNFETGIVTDITSHSAKVTGNIIDLGEYEIIDHGHHWYSVTSNPQASETSLGLKQSPGSFTSLLQDLQPGTEYKITSYVENSNNEVFLMETAISFKTLTINPPTVTTGTTTATSSTTATSGGNVTSDGGAEVKARGVCWSTSSNPTISLTTRTTDGIGIGEYTSNITGLSPNTTYYVRAYATNNIGTEYGIQINITTDPVNVTDIDGNIYDVVRIGTQIWMAANLKTTKCNDGSNIPLVNDNTTWSNLTTPGFCWYNNDIATYKNIYGALYNWYAVNTGKLCPTGWHIPSDHEWTTLTDYLGGESVAGGKLKSTGTLEGGTGLWHSPNEGATNETGFAAVPGSIRLDNGFFDIGYEGHWWSSTDVLSTSAWSRTIYCDSSVIHSYLNNKGIGFSVRCVRD